IGAKTSALLSLPLAPGPLETAAFELAEATVIADGARTVRLRVEMRDRYGNEVSTPEPELSAGNGSASLEKADGTLYAAYVPPLLRERSDTVLALRAGPAEARAHLTLLPSVHSAVFGAKAGFLSNFSGFSAPLIGIEGAYRTERFGPQLAFGLEADYAHRSYSEMLLVGTSSLLAESDVDLLLLHLSASWRQRFGDANTFWISAGPTLAAYWTRIRLGGGADRRGFATAPGLQGSLGFERRLRSVVPFLELRAGWITSSGLPILEGPLRTLSLFG